MQSASNTVMLAAAVAGVLAVGALAWRAVQTQTVPGSATRPATATSSVPPGSGSPTAPLATTPPPLSNTSPVTPGTTTSGPPAPAGQAPSAASGSPGAPGAAISEAAPRPSFDVVRIDPTGDAVVAGRAAPNATVTILNKGIKLAEVKADPTGSFAAIPPALPPGEHLLTLRVTGTDGDTDSEQSVAISVPDRPGAKVVAALTSPDQPTRILNDTAKPEPGGPQIAIRTVEAGQEGAFFASGTAPAGSPVRLYLNGAFVADVTAARDGTWSLRVEKGMAGGHYSVRADLLEPGNAKVSARAEVPFDYPAQVATGPASASSPRVQAARPASVPTATTTPQQGASPGSAPATTAGKGVSDLPTVPGQKLTASNVPAPDATVGVAVVREIQSVTVIRGDSLWRISRRVLGKGTRYTQIYEANASQIRDPNRIWPGQIFVAPSKLD